MSRWLSRSNQGSRSSKASCGSSFAHTWGSKSISHQMVRVSTDRKTSTALTDSIDKAEAEGVVKAFATTRETEQIADFDLP